MESFGRELVGSFFLPGGSMEQHIESYRHRQEQVRMAEAVADALANQEFLVAEVGTGVGKSYAYLLPAILWSLESGEKVVVSTRTRALQQQLMEHDIPDLKSVIERRFTCVEAKGRDNYLCWNKYMSILAGRKPLDQGEQQFMEKVLGWAEHTDTGDRMELGLSGHLMKHWDLLAANRRNCTKDLCRYRDKCFRLKMLKRLEKADLIIVNHALLLSDLLVDNSILPEYHNLVIDEAHTFERESFDKLSAVFSRDETLELLRMLYSRDRRFERGYVQHLKGRFPNLIVDLNALSTLVHQAIECLEECFDTVHKSGMKGEQNHSRVLEYRDFESPWFQKLVDRYLEWQHGMHLVINKLGELKERLSGDDEEMELTNTILSLQECSEQAYIVMEESPDRADIICWIDYQNGRPASLAASSIQIGKLLNQRLYSKMHSLVMVSATLAIEDSFSYFLDKTGLNSIDSPDRVRTLLEHSPFDYERHARLITFRDIAEPNEPGYKKAVYEVLMEVMQATGGRTMALFTSRSDLLEASSVLKPWAAAQGLRLLVQGEDGEFAFLMDEYMNSSNSILMGLETFWEGIDLKGELLKVLVIVRLPFRSPADPFCSAGDRYYRMLKRNSFQSFMLPDAAVRFKQGTGRLIRSEADRGMVIVLDSRLENKAYGRVFKNSIPIQRVVTLRKKELQAYLSGEGASLLCQ